MMQHGGQLREASQKFGLPVDQWIDLSTGINPLGYPIPPIPNEVWYRLPDDLDELNSVAQNYYQTEQLLPLAGSQAAIKTLARLRPSCQVGIVHPCYDEHRLAWQQSGHSIHVLRHIPDVSWVFQNLDVFILVQPNNPTGHVYEPDYLQEVFQALSRKKGWLIIDEAFIEACPKARSTIQKNMPEGLIILRSCGKFWGLAGARIGFLIAHSKILQQARDQLGPWCLSGPSRWLMTQALADTPWHTQTHKNLATLSKQMDLTLKNMGFIAQGHCHLFRWLPTPMAAKIHDDLGKKGIFTRLFTDPMSLRFGLPKSKTEWDLFQKTLSQILIIHD